MGSTFKKQRKFRKKIVKEIEITAVPHSVSNKAHARAYRNSVASGSSTIHLAPPPIN